MAVLSVVTTTLSSIEITSVGINAEASHVNMARIEKSAPNCWHMLEEETLR